ncbi:unnamed protein product [Bursaphelenchus xylophilus]|uniref:acid phosphatase n=1 Tax=Bursaphelenchus xylophilus TaxID=6326 RepID=A0A1I7RYM1_BURXY|nr:unnamed protein product [Bursaphelenchus xylophilus]CAG9092531.1 unnamed protein product [Bursaphelenchus xylophilus]
MAMKLFICVLFFTVCQNGHGGYVNGTFGPQAVKGHKLEYMAAIWRHGDRAPNGPFKGDLYPESYWENGYGQLTNLGIQQQQFLGKWIRKRYIEAFKFLPNKYDANAIKIRTTSINRTRESALYNFKGLYGKKITYDTLKIVSPLKNETDIIGAPFVNCHFSFLLGSKGLKTREVAKFLKKNEKLVARLKNVTKVEVPVLLYLISLTDPFVNEKEKNLSLAKEYEAIYSQIYAFYIQSFRFVYGLDIEFQGRLDWRKALVTMHSGGLFNVLINDIEHKALCSSKSQRMLNKNCGNRAANDLKYRAFSMHDINVLAVLNNLNFKFLDYNKNDNAPVGSALFIELWNDPVSRQRYVKAIYRKKPDEIYDLSEEIADCKSIGKGLGCSAEGFITRSQKYLISDARQYCAQKY